MRSYQVVLKSGANMDVTADNLLDDPAYADIFFYRDEKRHVLACTVKRAEVAGLIIHPDLRMSRPLPYPPR